MQSAGILTFVEGLAYAQMARALYHSAVPNNVGFLAGVAENDIVSQDYLLDHKVPIVTVATKRSTPEPFWFEKFAYDVTPFDLTLKMDADCLIPAGCNLALVFESIRRNDLITGVPHTLDHQKWPSTAHRQLEIRMGMPTVYSTMFGFSKHNEAYLFYQHLKQFYHYWGRDELPMTKGIPLTTDTVYSMAWAACHTQRKVLAGIPFHHIKPMTMNWGQGVREDWTNLVPHSLDDQGRVFIGGMRATLPLHYHDKQFMTPDRIELLERLNVCSV
jgi:hypothetical protein